MSQTVLITGCSSGFGLLAAKKFQQNGWNVAATMRSPEKDTELGGLSGVKVIRLDVTDTSSIQSAISETLATFGSIDVLVNNAGHGSVSLFEQFTEASMRSLFETNVFGLMNTTREILPIMRKAGQGRIINVSSLLGGMGMPMTSIYSASKHAIQGFTESLSMECAPLGIQVKSVMPGAYHTEFSSNLAAGSTTRRPELSDYASELSSHMADLGQQMRSQGGKIADPQEVADAVYSCATSHTPVHNPVGSDCTMMMDMMEGTSREIFLDKVTPMLMPASLSSSTISTATTGS